MKTYLLDSDILIDFFKRKQESVSLVEELGRRGDLTISILSVTELRAGWTEDEASIYLQRLYDIADITPLTQEIAELAGSYKQSYAKKGITLSTIDMLIAATTIIQAYCLVTRNIKDYPLHELDLHPLSHYGNS